MAIAVGAHARSTSLITGATVEVTPTVTTQASGSSFYAFIGWAGSGAAPTITDSKANTGWAQVGSTTVSSWDATVKCALFEKVNGTGGTLHTCTATFVGGQTVATLWFLEVTGGLTASIRDQTPAVNDDSASPYTSNTATTTQANELLLAFAMTDSASGTETFTWGGTPAFTSIGEDETNASANVTGSIASANVTSTGTYNSSFTSAGAGTTRGITLLITLKDLVAGGSTASDPIEGAARRQLRQNAAYRMSPRSEREAQQYLQAQKRAYGFAPAA